MRPGRSDVCPTCRRRNTLLSSPDRNRPRVAEMRCKAVARDHEDALLGSRTMHGFTIITTPLLVLQCHDACTATAQRRF